MTDDTKQDGAPEGQSASKAELCKAALELYKPPFKHAKGYIFDDANEMVADDVLLENSADICRVRGWGRIQYLPDPEALQDKVGEIIAEALNDFWKKHSA